jgi:hypothetical protein
VAVLLVIIYLLQEITVVQAVVEEVMLQIRLAELQHQVKEIMAVLETKLLLMVLVVVAVEQVPLVKMPLLIQAVMVEQV